MILFHGSRLELEVFVSRMRCLGQKRCGMIRSSSSIILVKGLVCFKLNLYQGEFTGLYEDSLHNNFSILVDLDLTDHVSPSKVITVTSNLVNKRI